MNENSSAAPGRLTPAMASRRLLVLRFVTDYIVANAGSPSIGEIAAGLKISRVLALRHVNRLAEDGELIRTPGKTRGLRLPTMRDAALRLLREQGWTVNEDIQAISRELPNRQLLPPPALTYRRSRTPASAGAGGNDDGKQNRGGTTGR